LTVAGIDAALAWVWLLRRLTFTLMDGNKFPCLQTKQRLGTDGGIQKQKSGINRPIWFIMGN